MSLLKKIKDNINSLFSEKISFDGSPTVSSAQILTPPDKNDKAYMEAFKDVSWVYACISAIAEDTSVMDLRLYRLKANDDIERIERHKAIDTLNHVNDFMTQTDLFKLHQIYMLTTGKSFWHLHRDNLGEPKEIYILRPDLMKIESYEDIRDGLIKQYRYGPKNNEIIFEPEEIIYFADQDPMDIRDGVGTVEPSAKAADTIKYAQEWNRDFFFNNATPDLLLTIQKTNLNEKQKERLRKDWENKFGGTKKRSRLAIVQGEAKAQEIGLKQRDIQFLEGQKWSRDEIMAMHKVPRTVLGITDDVNRANAEATEWIFAKRTIKPKMEAIVDQLNKSFIPMFGDDLFLDYEDPTPEDRIAKSDYYDKAVNKWMTVNEVRQELGHEPVEGGDFLYISANQLPINEEEGGEKMIKLKAPKKKKISDYARKHIKTMKQPEQEADKDKLKNMLKDKLKKEQKKYEYKLYSEKGRDRYWKTKNSIDERFEAKIEEETEKLMDEQKSDILAEIDRQKSPERKKNIEDWLFNKGKYQQLYASLLSPIITDLIREVGTNTLRFMGFDLVLDTRRSRIQKYLKINVKKMSKSIVDTQYDRLYKTLKEGVDEGEGAPALARRVESEFNDLKRYQSERIARTEVLRASNKATIEAYRETDVVVGKEWLTARDGRVCDWCDPMDGKIIPDSIDKNFFNKGDEYTVETDSGTRTMKLDYDGVDGPPLHVNCRCTTVPVIEGDTVPDDRVWDKEEVDKKSVIDEMEKELKKLKKTDINKIVGEKLDKLADQELSELRDIKKQIDEQIKEDTKDS